jgi:hypothetical protein
MPLNSHKNSHNAAGRFLTYDELCDSVITPFAYASPDQTETKTETKTQQSTNSEWRQPQPSPPTGDDSGDEDSREQADDTAPTDSNHESDTETSPNVESNWWKGLVIGIVAAPFLLVILLLAIGLSPNSNSPLVLTIIASSGILLLSLRVIFPLCIYLDARTLRSAPGVTGPRATPYIIGTLFAPPPIEFLTNIVYLAIRGKYAKQAKYGPN